MKEGSKRENLLVQFLRGSHVGKTWRGKVGDNLIHSYSPPKLSEYWKHVMHFMSPQTHYHHPIMQGDEAYSKYKLIMAQTVALYCNYTIWTTRKWWVKLSSSHLPVTHMVAYFHNLQQSKGEKQLFPTTTRLFCNFQVWACSIWTHIKMNKLPKPCITEKTLQRHSLGGSSSWHTGEIYLTWENVTTQFPYSTTSFSI